MFSVDNQEPELLNYRDRASEVTFRSYGDGGQFIEKTWSLTMQPNAGALTFIRWFPFLFIPTIIVVSWFLIPPPMKWVFMVAGPLAFLTAVGIIRQLVLFDVQQGPYLDIDLAKRTLRIRQTEQIFSLDDVVQFQLMIGEGDSTRTHTDLNLIVNADDGELERYFIMGAPRRHHLRRISEATGIPIAELTYDKKRMPPLLAS